MEAQVILHGELNACLIRQNGEVKDYGTVNSQSFTRKIFVEAPKQYLRRMWNWMRKTGIISGLISFSVFIGMLLYGVGDQYLVSIVTTAGATYMATDFASGGVSPTISGFKFHDAGTGSTAAAVGDTGLGTPWGGARVSGTASNPSAQVYRTVATIPFTGKRFIMTAKYKYSDADADAVFQKLSGTGITVSTATNGTATVSIDSTDTEHLPPAVTKLVWDVQMDNNPGDPITLERGTLTVYPDVTILAT